MNPQAAAAGPVRGTAPAVPPLPAEKIEAAVALAEAVEDCVRVWSADRGDAGQRLDVALVRHLANVEEASRSRLQAWIDAGRVRVNGRVATRPAARLAPGDRVEVVLPEPPAKRPLPAAQRMPLAILYEDEHLLAIDKPAGLVVHPTFGHPDGTLVNAIAWHLGRGAAAAAGVQSAAESPELCNLPPGFGGLPPGTMPPGTMPQTTMPPGCGMLPAEPARPGLVSRLDRDTSGVLLVAKTRAAHAGLARAIATRSLRKDYLAVAYGRAPLAKGRIDLRLGRDPDDRRRMLASRHQGLTAATLYELLAEVCAGPAAGAQIAGAGAESSPGGGGWLSLLACRLVTGRTHQIRAHLAALGLPIVGDAVYGEPRHRGIGDPGLAVLCRDFPRQALHAWRLGLRHPVGGRPLSFQAPLPADMKALLAAAGAVEAAGGAPTDAWAAACQD